MNELGAELDRRGNAGQAAREAAPADPVPRFNDQDGSAGARELRRRGEAGGAGADYEDVGLEPAEDQTNRAHF